MARQGRFQSARGQVSSRRLTAWRSGPNSGAVQSLVAVGSTLVSTGTASAERLTLVRIRGEITLWIRLATAIGDGFTDFNVGIGIVSANAFATGQAAIPTAGSDRDWPGWIWHHSGGAIVSLETTEVARGPMGAVRIPIDSKAMRKWRLNEVLMGSIQLGTEIGTAQVDMVMSTRVLIKLA